MARKIKIEQNKIIVPNDPVIPYIEGDGIGADIWKAAVRVIDEAVRKAYNDKRKIEWMEVYAGEKANDVYEEKTFLIKFKLIISFEFPGRE